MNLQNKYLVSILKAAFFVLALSSCNSNGAHIVNDSKEVEYFNVKLKNAKAPISVSITSDHDNISYKTYLEDLALIRGKKYSNKYLEFNVFNVIGRGWMFSLLAPLSQTHDHAWYLSCEYLRYSSPGRSCILVGMQGSYVAQAFIETDDIPEFKNIVQAIISQMRSK